MSGTESFEQAMEIARHVMCEECELIDDYRSLCQAHDGCLDCERAMIARLKAAHNRKIRDTAQQQYHRGFDDGRHSMDAEHRAIAMRLRALPLDGVSHENLSQIARAVYHSDFGWTKGACVALRDELVRLMGGVSDDTCACAGGGACAADCGRDSGEQKEVGDGRTGDSCTRSHPLRSVGRNDVCVGRDSVEHSRRQEVEHGGAAHDSADDSRGGSCGELVHMDGVTYDVLDNERRKAVCELRKMTIDSDYHGNYQRIALAIGTVYDGESFASECVRDRLIHLLGGDRPSGIDVLREMDADGTSPNDDTTSSITHELREWASDRHCKGMSHTDALNIGLIADRIDVQFDRICQQQEDVLQSIIDEVVEERKSDRLRIEKMEKQRDHWHQEATDLMNRADDMERQRDELQAKLDAIRDALDG